MAKAVAPRRSRAGFAAAGIAVAALATWGAVQISRSPKTVPVPLAPPARDTGKAVADTQASVPASPPAPVRPVTSEVRPITTAVAPGATDSAADADTAAPNLGALDSPVLRRIETQRMYRVLGNRRAPNFRKAAAAAFLGQVEREAHNTDSALALFRMAYRLNPRPAYLQLIKTFGDTVTP